MKMKNRIKIIFALMLAVVIVFGTSIPAYAAVSPAKTNAYTGQTVTVKYSYTNIAGINGTFSYTNSKLFSNVKFEIDGLSLGEYNANKNTFAFFGTKPVNCTITLKLTVSSGAKIGDKCTISLEYETAGADGNMPSVPDYKYDVTTITIVEKPLSFTELEKQIKIAEALKKDDYTSKSWSVLSDALEKAKSAKNSKNQTEVNTAAKNLKSAIANLVSIYEGKLNFDELNRQITVAEGLIENNYDVASWDALKTALSKAKSVKKSKLQPEIDSAAAELKAAIEGLVKINYDRLSAAMNAIDDYIKDNKLLNLWNESQSLLQEANNALTSRDQQKVDEYSAKIESLLVQLKQAVAEMGGADGTVEKPDTVEPTDDYCNVKTHPIWIVLLWISFAANLVFIALIVMYFYKSRKR